VWAGFGGSFRGKSLLSHEQANTGDYIVSCGPRFDPRDSASNSLVKTLHSLAD
jgi:hypothetical protein